MKAAKTSVEDAPSHRRAQPVRQTRTNPPRSSATVARAGARDTLGAGPVGDQPIDIFPAITHFADAMTSLPKELVRHFTLLKEVDAKIFAPEEHLIKLVDAATNAPMPEPRANNEDPGSAAPASAPMSAQGSSSGFALNNSVHSAASADPPLSASSTAFDPANLHRRQLFRQTAFKIQEMLVSLEEKNHVISTANEALERQLARVEDVWPYIENEFSDEAKWGSTTHWAYPENRTGKSSHTERARRDGAAAISAAAQALADEAAARSDARKQAVQAKKNLKNSHLDADLDDRPKAEGPKKSQSSKSRKAADPNNVGLGISATSTNNPPQKRRKVEKVTNGGVPMDRAMSSVFGNNAAKAKTGSPQASPAPEAPKKRKALPSGASGQAKKRYTPSQSAASPAHYTNENVCSKNGASVATASAASSPVLPSLPDPKAPPRASPAPVTAPRPASSRARGNSIQSNAENGKSRPPLPPPTSVPNGKTASTPEAPPPKDWPRPNNDAKPAKEPAAPIKTEPAKKEAERVESNTVPTPTEEKKEPAVTERERRKSESVPLSTHGMPTVTTKSGRASKPSTPALATFQEAARSRSARNTEGGNGGGHSHSNSSSHARKHQKKGSTASIAHTPRHPEPPPRSNLPGDEDGDIEADEPTYCYCNGVSYGEMVACDSDDCAREWFHLACVGLKVAPGSKSEYSPANDAIVQDWRLTWRHLQLNGTAKTARSASRWAARRSMGGRDAGRCHDIASLHPSVSMGLWI